MQCPKCNNENPEAAKFCRECGEKLPTACPKCGNAVTPQDKFCMECGAKLDGTAPAKSDAPIPKLEDMHAQLQNLIPDELAQKYMSAEQQATGENRPITALFADISGFTPLSNTQSSEFIFQLVQDCFKQLNVAIADAFKKGVLRNTSIMIPGPVFQEAAEMYKNMDGLCVGLHATITDEWNTHRWGPILGAKVVPSLVKSDGTFFKTTQTLWENKPDYDEIIAEIKAQLDVARSQGLDVKYMDTHMAFSWFNGLEAHLSDFAESEGLIYRPAGLGRLPKIEGEFSDPVERFLAALDAAEDGKTYMVVGHPCYDTHDIQQMTYGDHLSGEIAKERDWERRIFMDDRVVEYFHKNDVQPIAYIDIT